MLEKRYAQRTIELMEEVVKTQASQIAKGGKKIAVSLLADGILHVFGSGHSALIAKEIVGRAGGILPVNAIPDPTEGTAEQVEGYGAALFARYAEKYGVKPGEVVIIISTSGRNPAPIEIAMAAKSQELFTIGITSLEYSRQVTSRHSSGKRLFEVVDLVLDNSAPLGDALIEVEGSAQKAGPASTITGALLANMLILRTIEEISRQGGTPPILISQNLEGAEEHNRALWEKYRQRLVC